MTKQELKERQGWTLNQKIDHAIGTVENFLSKTHGKVFISFSGGKDSTVLLDICRRYVNCDIKAVFNNTGNEYPEIVNFVKTIENVEIITPKINIRELISIYGFPIISKEVAKYIRDVKTTKSEKLLKKRLYGVHGKIPEKWKYIIKEPFMVSEKCCEILKKKPFAKYQKITGLFPIIGTMAQESSLRMQQYIRRGGCNSFSDKHTASYPLSIWTEDDIWKYIQKNNIQICSIYKDRRCKRTGCMFCGFGAQYKNDSRFEMLYDLHPRFYETFMAYNNNGITYREALRKIGVKLPDEDTQLKFEF